MSPTSRKTTKSVPPAPEPTWRNQSVEELAAQQGIRLPQDKQAMLGAAADLWETDEEFEEFLKGIYERRNDPPAARTRSR